MTVADESSPTGTPTAPRSWRARLHTPEFRAWLIELVRFLIVGGGSFVVDLGLYNLLVFGPGHLLGAKPVTAKVISTVVATLASWIGNRHWTFSAKRNRRTGRELVIYGAINAIGALIPIGTLAFSRYVLHLAGPLPDNAATILGIAVATVFRYAGYKLWVFTGSDGAENPPAGGSGDGDQGRHGEDHEAAIAVTQL